MNNIPKISIIVPVYNTEQYLLQCIESVLSQTYINFELILIDDGSSDKSPDICDTYARKDNRIKVIHKLNGGVSSARNIGIDNSIGNWIAFIDSDDWVNTDYLDYLVKAIDNNNMLIVQGFKKLLKNDDNSTIVDLGNHIFPSNSYYDLFSKMKLCNYGFPFAKLYSSEVIRVNNIRFDEDITMSEDMIFMLEYLLKIKTVKFISYSNYYYRVYTPGLCSKIPRTTSVFKLCRSLSTIIDRMAKQNIINYDFIELKQIIVSSFKELIFNNYRAKNKKKMSERLFILNKLKESELNIIEQYYRINNKYMFYLFHLLAKRKIKIFDFVLVILFKIHPLIRKVNKIL